MMKKAIIISCAFLFLIANLILADLIYFDNGDIDEGFATPDGVIMTIRSKDKKGEYGVSTNRVLRVKVGLWFEDLNEAERDVAESSKKMESVEKILDPIEYVKHTIPAQLQIHSTKLNKITGLLPNNKDSTLMRFSSVFLLLMFIILIIVSAVCNIIVLVDAFKNSIAWGILSLLVPIVLLVYLLTAYRGNKGKIFFWMLSPIIWFGLMLLAFS
ncbi:hypothetical protein KAH27_01435 [bacterium]|nr:hypothetical protein [bacterium]